MGLQLRQRNVGRQVDGPSLNPIKKRERITRSFTPCVTVVFRCGLDLNFILWEEINGGELPGEQQETDYERSAKKI